MFEEKLQNLLGFAGRGWKIRAAELLKITRPTLDRYLQLDAEGQIDRIPHHHLAAVGIDLQNLPVSSMAPEVKQTPYDMANLFAAGLCKLQEHIDRYGHILSPYPSTLIQGFNLAAALNIERGTSYPSHLSALITCASQNIFQWCPEYAEGEQADSFFTAQLLDDGEVTIDCIAMAGLATRDAEEEFYQALIDICQELDDREGQKLYTEWRRAVIENPVASSHTIFLMNYPTLQSHPAATKQLIDFFYENISPLHAEKGKLALCPVTGIRLRRHGTQWHSEFRDPIAERTIRQQGPKWVDHTPSTLELKRPVRTFWALPGWHEIDLYQRIKGQKYAVTLWPNYDAVDLVVKDTASNVLFAVDVKDYLSPTNLAKMLKRFKNYRHHKTLVVIPDYLEKRLPDYRTIFEKARRADLKTVPTLTTVSGFINMLEGAP